MLRTINITGIPIDIFSDHKLYYIYLGNSMIKIVYFDRLSKISFFNLSQRLYLKVIQ